MLNKIFLIFFIFLLSFYSTLLCAQYSNDTTQIKSNDTVIYQTRLQPSIKSIKQQIEENKDKVLFTGRVLDIDKQIIQAAAIFIKGTSYGTFTNDKGVFKFAIANRDSVVFPFKVEITASGYYQKELTIYKAGEVLSIALKPKDDIGQEVVVTASRTRERLLESGVSIEQLSAADIKAIATPNYYQALANLTGVDLTTSSLNFLTLSTRGFNGSPYRFNQFIDGMDNQAPGLNFSAGNILGITQLDIDNLELLQGVSSALYGTGGTNGTLRITSKDPFKYQGLSFQIKEGINNVGQSNLSNFVNNSQTPSRLDDWEVRYGLKVNRYFAFKVAVEYNDGRDWRAQNYSDLNRGLLFSTLKPGGTRQNDPNYDGLNVYGDEASINLNTFAQRVRFQIASNPQSSYPVQLLDGYLQGNGPKDYNSIVSFVRNLPTISPSQANILIGTLPFLLPTSQSPNNPFRNLYGNANASRTGYNEVDIANYNNNSLKINGGLYFHLTSRIELALEGFYGRGNSVLTVTDRYVLKNFQAGQYKIDLKGKKWHFLAYTTQENSGDTYTATATALGINNIWKDNTTWFSQYVSRYFYGAIGQYTGGTSINNTTALDQFARNGIYNGQTVTIPGLPAADAGRLLPGTQAYYNAYNSVINTPLSKGGSRFYDRSALYSAEGQYNVLPGLTVGASWRIYVLNSQGTVFSDTAGRILSNEYGVFTQFERKFFNEKLKVSLAVRYDTKDRFTGRVTPRISFVYNPQGEHFIRFSVQTGYRFPSNQDQFLNLPITNGFLIGALPGTNSYYQFDKYPAYTAQSINNFRNNYAVTGQIDTSLLVPTQLASVQPEQVISFELGYRSTFFKKIYIDAYVYTSTYTNFIGQQAFGRAQDYTNYSGFGGVALSKYELLNPYSTTNYVYAANSSTPIRSFGWGISADYKFFTTYKASINLSGDQLYNVPTGFLTYFNTPKFRFNTSLSNPYVWKNFGFSATYRWQDVIYWESVFGTGTVNAYGTLDGYISYALRHIKSSIRIGGSNLVNNYYIPAFGNPGVGAIYYVSFGYNVL